MTNKEKTEMTRLWWKLKQGQATSDDIRRYRGLRARTLKENAKSRVAGMEGSRRGAWEDRSE